MAITSPKSQTLLLLLHLLSGVHGALHGHRHRHPNGGPAAPYKFDKLFAFGDSYADTGNIGRPLGAWHEPYGVTFPGKPAGRFSDGRVFTDYLAKYIGIHTPLPYKYRSVAGKHMKRGVNFAYGGSGVFATTSGGPNLTIQIDSFQRMIDDGVFAADDLQSSIAYVSVAGNDFTTHMEKNPSTSTQGWMVFIQQLVNQLTLELQRIRSMGIKKVAVNNLQPLGCLPSLTSQSLYQQCDETVNLLSNFHFRILKEAVGKLNKEANETSSFVVLDLFTAFMDVLRIKDNRPGGGSRFRDPLKPCCVGNNGEACGTVDGNGAKLYQVCNDRGSYFFWDRVHPTQEGWRSVYMALQANLKQLDD